MLLSRTTWSVRTEPNATKRDCRRDPGSGSQPVKPTSEHQQQLFFKSKSSENQILIRILLQILSRKNGRWLSYHSQLFVLMWPRSDKLLPFLNRVYVLRCKLALYTDCEQRPRLPFRAHSSCESWQTDDEQPTMDAIKWSAEMYEAASERWQWERRSTHSLASISVHSTHRAESSQSLAARHTNRIVAGRTQTLRTSATATDDAEKLNR